MAPIDDCILGDSALHERLCATTEILARLVSSAPRAVSQSRIEESTGRSAKDVASLCAALECAGLLRAEEGAHRAWRLNGEPSRITLEDVFRCVVNERAMRSHNNREAEAAPLDYDVNLLVMQAMIAVNQSVFKHLRQFSLDRLKISAAGVFPAPRRRGGSVTDALDEARDVTVSGRESAYGSLMQATA